MAAKIIRVMIGDPDTGIYKFESDFSAVKHSVVSADKLEDEGLVRSLVPTLYDSPGTVCLVFYQKNLTGTLLDLIEKFGKEVVLVLSKLPTTKGVEKRLRQLSNLVFLDDQEKAISRAALANSFSSKISSERLVDLLERGPKSLLGLAQEFERLGYVKEDASPTLLELPKKSVFDWMDCVLTSDKPAYGKAVGVAISAVASGVGLHQFLVTLQKKILCLACALMDDISEAGNFWKTPAWRFKRDVELASALGADYLYKLYCLCDYYSSFGATYNEEIAAKKFTWQALWAREHTISLTYEFGFN